jgi:hypothetical protein
MKYLSTLFVLMLGLAAANELKAQSTPTAATTVSAFSQLLGTPRVSADSNNIFQYQFYVFTPNVDIPATDVVLTVTLPVQIGYVNGDSSCTKVNPTVEQTIVTCNLGTVMKHPIDYSRFLRFYVFPQVAGEAIVTATIQGSNTPAFTFTRKITILPEKSRKRVRFF